MAEPVQQRPDHLLLPEEGVPLLVLEIGGDDRRLSTIPLLHELEEDVGLFGAEVQVAKLVHDEQIDLAKPVDQLPGRVIRQAGVHLVEQILRLDEQAAVPRLQGLQQDPDTQAGLAGPGRPTEHDVARST